MTLFEALVHPLTAGAVTGVVSPPVRSAADALLLRSRPAPDPGPAGDDGAQTGARLLHRSSRLGHGLRRAGATEGTQVVVLEGSDVDDDHLAIWYLAVRWAGANPVVVTEACRERTTLHDVGRVFLPTLVMGGEQGARAWSRAFARGRVVGDGPDQLWWRTIELQGEPTDGVPDTSGIDTWIVPDSDRSWHRWDVVAADAIRSAGRSTPSAPSTTTATALYRRIALAVGDRTRTS